MLRTAPLKRHREMLNRLAGSSGCEFPDRKDEYTLREMQMDFDEPLVEYSSGANGFRGWRLTDAGRRVSDG